MKITIEVDCTPEEARRFLGLPDLGPAREAVVEALRDETLKRLAELDPQSLMKAWMPGGGEAWESVQKAVWGQMGAAAGRGGRGTNEEQE